MWTHEAGNCQSNIGFIESWSMCTTNDYFFGFFNFLSLSFYMFCFLPSFMNRGEMNAWMIVCFAFKTWLLPICMITTRFSSFLRWSCKVLIRRSIWVLDQVSVRKTATFQTALSNMKVRFFNLRNFFNSREWSVSEPAHYISLEILLKYFNTYIIKMDTIQSP